MKTPKARRNTPLVLVILIVLVTATTSCASKSDARTVMQQENQSRSYERFKSDHMIRNKDDLQKAGIYYDGRSYYVVISLTDSGTDRYPEWACDRFLNMLYGYGAVVKSMVSDNEFYELALQFTLEEVQEGKYENLARVSIRERDVENFIRKYRDEG